MSKVTEIARKEIGTIEEPVNNVKYNTWFYKKSVSGSKYAWCGTFVSWCFYKAGVPLPTIDYTRGFAGCTYAVNNVYRWGRKIDRKDVQMDDVVFFDWDGNKVYDHTAIFVKDNGDGVTFTTIEGNTAIPKTGMTAQQIKEANSNGGMVLERNDRKYSQAIFVRPNIIDILT